MATELSKVKPDRDDLVNALETALQGKGAWTDRVISSTGRTLVDLLAAIGAYSQYSIESAYQEAWPESAKTKEGLYAAANYLGVRYNRKLPARVTASLVAASTITVPPMSQFTIAGTLWFNRNALSLSTTPSSVSLYQGKVVTVTVNGLDTDFQAYVTPEAAFTVSDIDVQVVINGGAIPTVLRGLWTMAGVPGVQHFTLPAGNCVLLFGNDTYGSKPGINDEIDITYAVTFGTDGNNLPIQSQNVFLVSDTTVTGTATTAASEGSNETDAFAYKNITPALSGSFDSAITPAQYKALPLLFPSVVDAQTFAQREINPKALTWMNNIRVVILPTSPWSGATWNTFVEYMQEKTMYKCQFIRKDPVQTNVNVDVDVFCTNYSNLSDVKAKVEAAITNLFAPRQGILGFDFYRADIHRVIEDCDPNVEYAILNSPTTDIILSSLNVKAPTLTVESGGTLPIGVYDYGISVVSTLGGETAPANWSSVTTTLTNRRIRLNWQSVPNAASYKIWGRVTGNALGLIATVASPTLTYTDTGSITPSGLVPVEATIDSYYAKLNTLTVRTSFSTRPVRLEEN